MEKRISGIHHVTAIASNLQRNLDFYIEVLGLRLVKRTVNFDDPGTYHFDFAYATGTPGTILTFFPGTTWSSWKSAIGTLTTRQVSTSRRLAWVVAGDVAYNDVHLYLAESNAQTRREWKLCLKPW